MPSNGYEVVRYKAYTADATKAMTHIVYRKDSGLLTWTGASMKHYQAFLDGAEFVWSKPYKQAKPPKTARKAKKLGTAARHREQILERDGGDCWFCGKAMGSDCTLEHLLPRAHGGTHNLANLVLAHAACNHKAADSSISAKVELRAKMRSAQNA